jgi:hypothetical protein
VFSLNNQTRENNLLLFLSEVITTFCETVTVIEILLSVGHSTKISRLSLYIFYPVFLRVCSSYRSDSVLSHSEVIVLASCLHKIMKLENRKWCVTNIYNYVISVVFHRGLSRKVIRLHRYVISEIVQPFISLIMKY